MSSPTWPTPNRHTRLRLDVPEVQLLRPSWSMRRHGGQIARARLPSLGSERVKLQPGGGWTLAPLRNDLTQIVTNDYSASVITEDDLNLATGWESYNTYKKPTETGIGASGSVISAGAPALRKQVAAGSTWDTSLTADVAAFPYPTLDSTDIPMNRVASGKVTYPANCGFALVVTLPADFVSPDNILNFYFGGPTGVRPRTPGAGQFALNLRGNGQAVLYEWIGEEWVRRFVFGWADPLKVGNLKTVAIRIFPYARDTIAFTTTAVGGHFENSGAVFSGALASAALSALAPVSKPTEVAYRTEPLITGYRNLRHVTGPGTIRLDVRRDLRLSIQLIKLTPPEDGYLTDLPFQIPYPVPVGTVLTVTGHTYLPTGTDIDVQLYNANTGAALSPTGISGRQFLTVAGNQAYFARFLLQSDSDQEQTPVLYGYRVDVSGLAQSRSVSVTTGGNIRTVDITGPSLDPAEEMAHVTIHDPTDALETLRVRARHRAQLAVYADNGTLTSILLDGEVVRADATKKGLAGATYPDPEWRYYDVTMAGMWARLADAIGLDLEFFDIDPNAPADPVTGQQPPWKITSIIAYLLEKAGFSSSFYSIPDLPMRLWPGVGQTMEDFILQPPVSIADHIMHLVRDYLGMRFFWDPNAGVAGLWRLQFLPIAAATPLAAFINEPTVSGRLVSHPNSYPAGTAFIQSGTFRSVVKPPEGNFVRVVGRGASLPGDGGPTQLAASMYNPVSFDFLGATSDPTHIDYLGRFVPIVIIDPTLWTQEAVNFVCRRTYDVACHGIKILKWRSPLLLITDGSDSLQTRVRPLRFGDPILFRGAAALVRSCNPSYDSDGAQMMDMEAALV